MIFSSCRILLNLKFWYTIESLANSRRDLQNLFVASLMVVCSSLCSTRTSLLKSDLYFDRESCLVCQNFRVAFALCSNLALFFDSEKF